MSSSEEDSDMDDENSADWMAHHSGLERERRDAVKGGFAALQQAVPTLQGAKASRKQILEESASYMRSMKRRKMRRQHQLANVRRESKLPQEQIRKLNEAMAASSIGEPVDDNIEQASSSEIGSDFKACMRRIRGTAAAPGRSLIVYCCPDVSSGHAIGPSYEKK
ncbi:protein max-like [Haemaphysalis longicornis]